MSTTTLARQALLEIRRQRYSRTWLALSLAMLASSVIAFSGTLSTLRSAYARFAQDVADASSEGRTLEQALREPSAVIRDGDLETITNPLKYDYQRLGETLHSVTSPAGVIATSVELATFLVIPLAFMFIGCSCAVTDRAAGTLKLRASTDTMASIVGGKMIAIAATALFAVAALVVSGLLVFAAGRFPAADAVAQVEGQFHLAHPGFARPLALKLLLCAAFAFFFGIVGYAIGTLARSLLWPMVAAALVLFVVPFLSAWDPRNLLAVIAGTVFEFWGQFELRPPVDGASVPAAVAVVLALTIGAGLVAALLPRGRRRYL